MALKFLKLTRPDIRKLNPGQKIIEHGIMFERLMNGDGRYTVNVRADGIRVHRVIGKESEGVTRQQAEDFITKAKTDARAGRLNLPKGRKTAFPFDQAAGKYLAKLKEEDGNDIPKKRERLNKHLIPFFKRKPIDKISTFDIERFKKNRKGKASPGTINRELAVISHIFNKAMEWKWIDYMPAKIKRLKEDSGRIIYLTTDQMNRLLEVAKRDQSPNIYPFILIGLETSMRRMEILTIKPENIDLEKRVIYIPNAKSGPREQPITKNLAEYLHSYLKSFQPNQVWLFPSPIIPHKHLKHIEIPFRRVVKAAGLDPKQIVRHTLRHTAITHLVQAGVDLPTVKRISGHKTLSMVGCYSQHNSEHIQAAMGKLESRYIRSN